MQDMHTWRFAGLPHQSYPKQQYFTREKLASDPPISDIPVTSVSDQLENKPSSEADSLQIIAEPPAEEVEDDPLAELFKQSKRESEEKKKPVPKVELEDDDLAHLSDDETNQEYPPESDLMCGLYSKVLNTQITRSKSKWKCSLSNCVLNYTGKDVVFKQVQGTMNFQ